MLTSDAAIQRGDLGTVDWSLFDYVMVDLFAGGGGSGSGALEALEIQGYRTQGNFINHWDEAMNIHAYNHPDHRHFITGVDTIPPLDLIPAHVKLNLLWASPSCVHFSVARGGKPVDDQSRCSANCVLRWLRDKQPDILLMENVREFAYWGPVIQKLRDGVKLWLRRYAKGEVLPPRKDGDAPFPKKARKARKEMWLETRGVPFLRYSEETEHDYWTRLAEAGYAPAMEADKSRKGEYFDKWVQDVKDCGYELQWRVFCSADYGDPTSRKRLFVQAVRNGSGKRICWPNKTHAQVVNDLNRDKVLGPWPVARDCIDWSKQGQSIVDRAKALSKNTMSRIIHGLIKYGLEPFIVPQHQGYDKTNVRSVVEPVSSVTARHFGEALLDPCLIHLQGESNSHSVGDPVPAVQACPKHYVLNPSLIKLKGTGRSNDIERPVDTVAAGGLHHALMEAFLLSIDQTGSNGPCVTPLNQPIGTLVTKANQCLVTSELTPFVLPNEGVHRGNAPRSVDDPLNTVTSRGAGHLITGEIKPFTISAGGPECPATQVDNPLGTVLTRDHRAVVSGKLTEFLVQTAHGVDYRNEARRAHSVDKPLTAVTSGGTDQAVVSAFLIPNFGERPGQEPRVHSINAPVPAVTSHGAGVVITSQLKPLHERHTPGNKECSGPTTDSGGHSNHGQTSSTKTGGFGECSKIRDNQKEESFHGGGEAGVRHPAEINGQESTHKSGATSGTHSAAAAIEHPVTSAGAGGGDADATPGSRTSHPSVQHSENGETVHRPNSGVEPAAKIGKRSADRKECIDDSHEGGSWVLTPFLVGTAHSGGDSSRAHDILEPLATVCGNRGDLALIRPYLLTYYGSGSEGQTIDSPMRTATTKARIGLVQPVIEFNGQFYILELRFRMLTWRELARAQGFRDSYEFPTTATNAVRAIGNAVSRRLARALVLATTSQQEDIRPFLENIHDPIKELPEAA